MQNKGRTERSLRRASRLPAHPLQEAGGRGEGKGANSAPEMASPTKLQTDSQSLIKDFLRFWMIDIRREGCAWRPAPQNRHQAHPTGAHGN